jgi:hypothetical protein
MIGVDGQHLSTPRPQFGHVSNSASSGRGVVSHEWTRLDIDTAGYTKSCEATSFSHNSEEWRQPRYGVAAWALPQQDRGENCFERSEPHRLEGGGSGNGL